MTQSKDWGSSGWYAQKDVVDVWAAASTSTDGPPAFARIRGLSVCKCKKRLNNLQKDNFEMMKIPDFDSGPQL